MQLETIVGLMLTYSCLDTAGLPFSNVTSANRSSPQEEW